MKKIIRLTEGDLHRVIENAVRRVLKEETLNELDPRTYASYADKRAAQGQDYKASQGRQAAVDAWNKKYAFNRNIPNGYMQKDGNGGYYQGFDNKKYRMSELPMDKDNPKSKTGYATEFWHSQNYPGSNSMQDTEEYHRYNPYTQTSDHYTYGNMKNKTMGYGGFNNRPGEGGYRGKYPVSQYSNGAELGYGGDRVARQMALGNGKYVKGKGWD